MIELLLGSGADTSLENWFGETAADLARETGDRVARERMRGIDDTDRFERD